MRARDLRNNFGTKKQESQEQALTAHQHALKFGAVSLSLGLSSRYRTRLPTIADYRKPSCAHRSTNFDLEILELILRCAWPFAYHTLWKQENAVRGRSLLLYPVKTAFEIDSVVFRVIAPRGFEATLRY